MQQEKKIKIYIYIKKKLYHQKHIVVLYFRHIDAIRKILTTH